MNDKTVEHVVNVIKTLREKCSVGVIKDYEIPPLVNMRTGQDTGFAVILYLSSKYDYTEEILKEWKQLFQADEWYITAKRNKLLLTFRVHYKKEEETNV